MIRWALAGVLTAVSALPSGGAMPPCPAGELPGLAVPRGVYHGAMADFSSGERNEDYVTIPRLRAFARRAGRALAWAYFSQHFFRGVAFPERAVQAIWHSGAVPVVRLMPWSAQVENRPERTYSLEAIATGEFDAALRAWGAAAAGARIPLVVEFGPEVNGDWFPWNGAYHGAGSPGPDGPRGPSVFRAAFRRVVDDIRSGGAYNVEFAFHVEDYSQPDVAWNQPAEYYPGDPYVDWVGVSIYATDPPLAPFADTLADVYARLTRFAPTKPVAISEYGASGAAGQRAKAAWVQGALTALASDRFPRVHAASWWDERFHDGGRLYDYRINSSPMVIRAYRRGVRSPRFATRPQVTCR